MKDKSVDVKRTSKVVYVPPVEVQMVRDDTGRVIEIITTHNVVKTQEDTITRLSKVIAEYQTFYERVYNQVVYFNSTSIREVLNKYDLFGRHK